MSKWLQFSETQHGILIDLSQFVGMKPTREMFCRHCQKMVRAFGASACNAGNRPDREYLIEPQWLKLTSFCSECGWLFRQLRVPDPVRAAVIKLDGNQCVYCGRSQRDTPGLELTFDHVIPQLLGGRETVQNIVQACGTCNSSKGAKKNWYKPQFGRFAAPPATAGAAVGLPPLMAATPPPQAAAQGGAERQAVGGVMGG